MERRARWRSATAVARAGKETTRRASREPTPKREQPSAIAGAGVDRAPPLRGKGNGRAPPPRRRGRD
ncbi:hypothetical protein U9M48_034554 [Paspalum notatum var. saurae]|uniref:Uncharacterized protein n=1 Tax=Paspalum notatum var. saurae TaxID=547442 RepID=A0AAQ3X7I9_PASNO